MGAGVSAARVRELRRLPSVALVPGDLVVVVGPEASDLTGAEAEVESREGDELHDHAVARCKMQRARPPTKPLAPAGANLRGNVNQTF